MTDQPKEPRVSEQMWAVAWMSNGVWQISRNLWRKPKGAADAAQNYTLFNPGFEVKAVRVTVTVDPGQLEEKKND